MAVKYTEASTTGANLLTDINTAILLSSEWARPNSGTFPTLYKATSANGAQMCVDIATIAPLIYQTGVTFYRTHDGTTAVDSKVGNLRYKRLTTGTFSSTTFRFIVSAGPEHLFLMIEGPRAGETNADTATSGSMGNYIFISSLIPYNPEDTIPAVVIGFQTTATAVSTVAGDTIAYVNRNAANNTSWTPGHLNTLDFPSGNSAVHINNQYFSTIDGGKFSGAPYVFVDNAEGYRGRLSSFFNAGYNFGTYVDVPLAPIGAIVDDVDGNLYKLIAPNRTDGSSTANALAFGALGCVSQGSVAQQSYSPVIAVPYGT